MAVGGDIVGSLIVTGDNNVVLHVGGDSGALMERLGRRGPRIEPLALPRNQRPARFPDHMNRATEMASVLAEADRGFPVNVHGDAGIGKTYVLVAVAHDPATGRVPSGVIYLSAQGMSRGEVLQELFGAFYTSDLPVKRSAAELRRDLDGKRALLLLDRVELDRGEAQALLLAVPGSAFVVASRERVVWDGTAVPVRGLALQDAVRLFEREVGHRLEGADRSAAESIATALQGHPLRIRQVAAHVREADLAVQRVAAELAGGDPAGALVAGLSPEERRVAEVLAGLPGIPVGPELVAAATGLSDVGLVLSELERRHIVTAHSPRYELVADVARHLEREPAVADALGRWVGIAASWAEANRAEPTVIVAEAPALVELLRLTEVGSAHDLVRLGRAVEAALACAGRWDAWGQAIQAVLEGARRTGDRGAEGWALHQRGTRTFLLGDRAQAVSDLRAAVAIRTELGDADAVAASRHNLNIARGQPPWRRWLWPILLALIVVGVLAALIVWLLRPGDVRLNVTVAGPGTITSKPTGIACPPACTHTFEEGTDVTLTARPASGAQLDSWGDGCADADDATCTLAMDQNQTVTAVFAQPPRTHSLTVDVTGSGTVTSNPKGIACPRSCSDAFDEGTDVALTASPGQGSVFTAWGGACEAFGADPACTLTASQDRTVTASFANTYSLTITVTGPGTVIVKGVDGECADICSHTFTAGQKATLTAQPNTQVDFFRGWGGACETFWRDPECTLTIDQDQEVTAIFSSVE